MPLNRMNGFLCRDVFGTLIPLITQISAMIKNLLLTALRNFTKDKWYTLINVLGLTIGITFSLFLIFYVNDELSYDRHQKNADRIYRINSYIQEKDKNTDWALTQSPMGPQLKKDYPEVEEQSRFFNRERTLFKNGEKQFYETNFIQTRGTLPNLLTSLIPPLYMIA